MKRVFIMLAATLSALILLAGCTSNRNMSDGTGSTINTPVLEETLKSEIDKMTGSTTRETDSVTGTHITTHTGTGIDSTTTMPTEPTIPTEKSQTSTGTGTESSNARD